MVDIITFTIAELKSAIFLWDDADFTRFIRSMREFNVIQPIGSLYEKNFRERNKEIKETESPIGDSVSSETDKLVDFISYCLIPNHHHFILKQIADNGISKFMHKLNIGYSMYFNKKYNRSGSLFGGPFKVGEVNSYSHLLKLIVYVNCNYEAHGLGKADNWPWSSFLDYIEEHYGNLCNKNIILEEFGNVSEFKNFCDQVLPDIIGIKELKKCLLEE